MVVKVDVCSKNEHLGSCGPCRYSLWVCSCYYVFESLVATLSTMGIEKGYVSVARGLHAPVREELSKKGTGSKHTVSQNLPRHSFCCVLWNAIHIIMSGYGPKLPALP